MSLKPPIPTLSRLLWLRARNSGHPSHAVLDEQLQRRLRMLVQRPLLVQRPGLDDLCVAVRRRLAPERRATAAAKVRRDGRAAVGRLGERLGRALRHPKPGRVDDDVGREGGPGDFAAVQAVAKRLCRREERDG